MFLRFNTSDSTKPPGTNSTIIWILLIAAGLRLFGLTGFSLSNDELSALSRLQFSNVHDVITLGVYPDFHPAGVQLFLYFWTFCFGFSEFMVRLPFALLGVGSVYLLYRVGKLWFGYSTGILAAASLAVLEFPLLYSQIARPYSPGLFFTLLTVFFWTRAIFNGNAKSVFDKQQLLNFLGFSLSVSACMYIHYFSFILAGLICLTGLFFLKRTTLAPYMLSGILILLLYLPHQDLFIHQLMKGGVGGPDGWLGPPGEDAFSKFIDYCFNDSYQLKIIYFILFAGIVLSFRKEVKFSKFHAFSILLFILPFFIAYYYSIWKNPVFQHSVLLFSFPYLLLFIFSFFPKERTGTTLSLLLLAVLAGGLYSTVTEKKYYKTKHFSEFRGIAERVKQLDDQLGSENITRTISVFSSYYIQYYLDYYKHPVNFEQTSIMTKEEIVNFNNLVEQSTTPYFFYSYSNVYDDPDLDMIIRAQYPWLLVKESMLNSGLKLYGKVGKDSALNRLPAFTYKHGFETEAWKNELSFRDSTYKYEGKYSVHLSADKEFGPSYQKNIRELNLIPGSKIEINAAFFSSGSVNNAKLVLSVDKNGKSLIWVATNLDKYLTEKNKWTRVFLTVTLPNELSGDEELNIYTWNEKREDYFMDDFRMNPTP